MESKAQDSIQNRLIGWKMIARYLGRSERAAQFWEEQRGLPVHRIPGARGHTVYAYVAELAAWMDSGAMRRDEHAPAFVDGGSEASITPVNVRAVRPPGILVLPVERRPDVEPVCSTDALCQQLIVRLSAMQPVRVLSWTTSRSIQQSAESMETMALRHNVRYLVESVVERSAAGLHVDIRIVDAEIDQIVLADRFLVMDGTCSAAYADLADGVALHFALIHAGVLVEPICLDDLNPVHFLNYLRAVQTFFDDRDAGDRALAELDRALDLAPHFMPARAMRGLMLVQRAAGARAAELLEESRKIFASCRERPAARVTSAFLGTALAHRSENIASFQDSLAKMALRWVPPACGREGRLYERRSPMFPREAPTPATEHGFVERRSRAVDNGHPWINGLLRAMAAVQRPHASSDPISARMKLAAVRSALIAPTRDFLATRHAHYRDADG